MGTDSKIGFSSGGGFSNYHKPPKYQQDALDTYFSQHNPAYLSYYYTGNGSIGADGGRYNRAGRGYPDVLASGFISLTSMTAALVFPMGPVQAPQFSRLSLR